MKASHPIATRAVLKPALQSTVLTMASPPFNLFEINERRLPGLSCSALRRALNPFLLAYLRIYRQNSLKTSEQTTKLLLPAITSKAVNNKT